MLFRSEEFGDLLFALVNAGRFLDLTPEDALRRAVEKFERRFRAVEEAYRVRNAQLAAGAAVVTDVLEADLALTRARLTRLDAALDAHLAHARLLRAAGQG